MGAYPSCPGARQGRSPKLKVRMLHQLLFTLMLASAMARGPVCSDGLAPTCTCSDGTLATKPPKPSPCADGSSPTCNGKVRVINVGTGNPLSSGPWTYDPESKLLQSDSGRWARSIKKHKLRMEGRVRYLKGTTTPWRWFQWNIVKV